MKKARFFYEMNYFLIVLLGWLLLFGKAIEINRGKTIGEKTTGEKTTKDSIGLVCIGVQNAKTEKMTEPFIRVLLMDSSWNSYYHPSVTLQYHGEEHTYTSASSEFENEILHIDGGEEGIAVPSISRTQGTPVYYGILEIKKTPKGLLLINQLPLEKYLEGVIPSEMPASYQEQALMAQAVCARTYAICQIEEKGLEEYGADVDDSVNYQVYGNLQVDEKTSRAVRLTKGVIMCQNKKPVIAYYFSTSAGRTSTDEIWGADKGASYLKSVECNFDQNMPWSSWNVEIPWETLEDRLFDLAGSRILKGLQIVKKSESGAATKIEISTENGNRSLEGEYKIREFFSPEGLSVTEKDGSVVTGGGLLPSAYFDLNIKAGRSVEIIGKGYGHGVGMSQNGANEMAKKGYNWREILNYFFKNITLERWQEIAAEQKK